MKIVILFGAPGSGKGTQADLLQQNLGLKKVSTGDILRAEIESGSELGNQLSFILKAGKLVSDDIIIDLIGKIFASDKDSKGFIFDGFPRTRAQAESLTQLILNNNLAKKDVKAIAIEVDDEVLVERIAGRFSCVSCKASYHKSFNKTKVEGVCDYCGGKEFAVREDDNADVLKTRLGLYKQETLPIMEYYQEQQNLYKIDGMGEVSDIAAEISSIVTV